MRYYIYDSNLDKQFKSAVRQILDENTVWRGLVPSTRRSNADFTIRLVPRSFLDRYHCERPEYYPSGKQIRFSFTINRHRIYIDAENWLHGVPESRLSLTEYQKYVILHEVGHALGYTHEECSVYALNCPVMYQMTRGPPLSHQRVHYPLSIIK